MTNNINDSVNTEEMSQEAQCVNQVHQQGTPNKEIKPKEKEDRIRLLREKQEMEIEKRKREIEENLKRKQELREKQMLERKKRLDEMKSKEMERRHAVEERRKQREQMNRLRMSEMLKKEQEREIQRVDLAKLASKFSAERPKTRESVNNQVITSLNEPNLNLSSSLLVSSSSNTSSNFNSYNKSQSVYNLSHKNSLHNNILQDSSIQTKRSNSSLAKHNKPSSDSRHPVTKPSRPAMFKSYQNLNNTLTPAASRPTKNAGKNNSSNNKHCSSAVASAKPATSSRSSSSFWQGPPAHFMLPTHAIHCRSSQSIERCPRACKAMTVEPINSASEPQPAKHSAKSLAPHLQSFVNRLSMPKKNQLNESSVARSSTPQPSPDETSLVSKKSAPKPSTRQIDSSTIKKPKAKAATSSKPTESKPSTRKSKMPNSQSMNVINQSNGQSVKAALSTCNLSDEIKPIENKCDKKEIEEKDEEVVEKSSSDSSKPIQSSSSLNGKTQEEEEYKRKLEEKRREAREKAAREAEIERQRLEALRLEEEEKKRQEEEEQIRLNQLAKEQEEERLRIAIQQEQERREKEENERKMKEEAERKARLESERQERERLEKVRKDEEERLERKKKVDMIMRRVQNKDDSGQINGSSNDLVKSNSNLNLLMTTSNNDLSSMLNTHNTSSMTTSMIEHSGSNESKIKTPLLQSILSKTRINTILNKYADDPVLSSSTLSLIAQNSLQPNENVKDENEEKVEFDLQLNEVNVEVNDNECISSTESNSSTSSASSPVSTVSVENNDLNHQEEISISPSNKPITA